MKDVGSAVSLRTAGQSEGQVRELSATSRHRIGVRMNGGLVTSLTWCSGVKVSMRSFIVHMGVCCKGRLGWLVYLRDDAPDPE